MQLRQPSTIARLSLSAPAQSEMDKIMKELARLRKLTMQHMMQLEPVMSEGDRLEKDLEKGAQKF